MTGAGGPDTATQTDLIAVAEPPPVAGLSAAPTSGLIPLPVSFSDLSTGHVTSWAWDFGDGTSSTLQNPAHTYPLVGTYTVSLTVTGDGGSNTASAVDLVVALEPPPVAGLAATPTSGLAPLAVGFSDLTSGDVSSWAWDFGDGTSSALQNPAHTYTTVGT